MEDAKTFKRGRGIWLAVVVAVMALIDGLTFYATSAIAEEPLKEFVGEAGPLEILQSGFMLAAVAVFGRAALTGRGALATSAGVLGVLSLSFLLREQDFREIAGMPSWLQTLTDSPGHDVIFGSLLLVALVMTVWFRADVPAWIRMLLQPRSLPLIAAGAFLFAGMVMDSDFVTNSFGRFWEELLEFNGYAMLLIAALVHLELALTGEA